MTDTPPLLTAVRRDQGFELVRDEHGSWWVRIGPHDTPPKLQGGKLSPARSR